MIATLVRKDLRHSGNHWIVAGILMGVITFFTAAISVNIRFMCFGGFVFQWWWPTVTSLYAVTALATSLAFGLSFADFYGSELRRGTVRALILYPVDFNDLTIAKLLAATIVGLGTSAMTFLVPMTPLVAACVYPAGGVFAIYLSAVIATLLIMYTAAFGSHILTHYMGRMTPSPSGAVALLLFLAIIFTQSGLMVFGQLFLNLAPGDPGFEDFLTMQRIAGGISVVSPHHAFAAFIAGLIGPNSHFPDFYVVVPVAVIAIAYGFWAGRRIPLDVFIH
jgi:hypothetical protein